MERVRYQPIRDYYLPDTKERLVNWFTNHYHNDPKAKWEGLKKNRLYAIYMALRSRKG